MLIKITSIILQTATRLRRLPSKETNIDEIFTETDKSQESERKKSEETNVDDITGHSSSRSDKYDGW